MEVNPCPLSHPRSTAKFRGGMLQPGKGTPEPMLAPLLWACAHGHRANSVVKQTELQGNVLQPGNAAGKALRARINPALNKPGSLKHKPQAQIIS